MIQSVYDQALCTACGACAAICHKDAIQMRENAGGYLAAHLDANKCIHCGRCLKVCPSIKENLPIHNIYEVSTGNCISGAIGYATDPKIRREGQSGGLVTALLLYLLETGKIDAAVTNSFSPEKERPVVRLATNKAELLESTGSYYTQTAVAETVLRNVDKKLAAVVLGCQAKALRLSKANNVILIGLICIGQHSSDMITYLANASGIKSCEKIKKFRFKYSHPAYGGWPGNVLLITDHRRYRLDQRYRLESKRRYESFRCLLCYDQINVDADLVCGDPWGIPGDHTEGKTIVIARTEKGRQLLCDAMEAGYITLESILPEQIIKGQGIVPRHIQKVYSGYRACLSNNWGYPYCFTRNIQKEADKVPKKIYSQYLVRMQYARKRFLCTDRQEIDKLTEKYVTEEERKKQWRMRKHRLLLPIRFVRSVIKKLQKG